MSGNQQVLLGYGGGYRIANSLRFRSSASAYLNRTFGTNGTSTTTKTLSFWVKRGLSDSSLHLLFGGYDGSSGNDFFVTFDVSAGYVQDAFRIGCGGASAYDIVTSSVYRDFSSWYHFVLAFDTTQATASNRVKIYVNGNQLTSFNTANYPAQNTIISFGYGNSNNKIGSRYSGAANFFDGYLADINFIDGQALTPSSFGAFNATTGVWQPIRYSGTYGTNGFKLNFSNGTSTTTLGYDSSGNGNNWTTNNISLTAGSTYDWMIDSPTPFQGSSYGVGNYAVLNPISNPNGPIYTVSNGNLSYSCSASAGNASKMSVTSSFGMSSGKWYCEATETSSNSFFGVTSGIVSGGTANGPQYAIVGNGGTGASAATYSGTTPTVTANDVIGFAFDAGALTVAVYKNGTLLGTFSGLESSVGTWFFIQTVNTGSASTSSYWNFGQRPFAYTPPSGYKSLCTYNLPTPTIQNGAGYMAATLWAGTNSNQNISNAVNGVSFQPDFVWVKSRSGAFNHALLDSIRGVTKGLASNSTAAETTSLSGYDLTAFNANGFTLGPANIVYVNNNGYTYVGWQWKAGGTAVTNTAGSITSSVSANTTSGFSVVTWTGNGSGTATVGHGLGVAPAMVITKSRSAVNNWWVAHSGIPTSWIQLDTTGAAGTGGGGNGAINYQNTFTNSVFGFIAGSSTTNNVNANGSTYVAYCFAAIPGYSAFGSYVGNSSTDGPFVYTGFRPRWILYKSTAGNWGVLYDTSENPYNVANQYLIADSSASQNNGGATNNGTLDILSNGFKLRDNSLQSNSSGTTYIYAAFAENPFTNALAR